MTFSPQGESSESEVPQRDSLLTASALGVLRPATWVLFGIFLSSVLFRSLPPRLIDPLWQISFISTLVDMGGYALLGVVVLSVAVLLAPGEWPLRRELVRVRRLSRFAALGFLLLVPLLVSALWRDHGSVEQQRLRQRASLQQWELRQRQAIGSARTRPELLQVVQGVNAQALPVFLASEAPLERQRAQALELLKAGSEVSRRQLVEVSPGSWRSILLNNLRLLVLALLFAFGFSSAFAGGPSFPLLGLFLGLVLALAELLPGQRSREGQPDGDDAYIESLRGDD
jgi:hypothetical protein